VCLDQILTAAFVHVVSLTGTRGICLAGYQVLRDVGRANERSQM